jgi:hypothetical protein
LHLIARDIDFRSSFFVEWEADNFLEIPFGSGSVSIKGENGRVKQVLLIPYQAYLPIVWSTNAAFESYELHFDQGISGIILQAISSIFDSQVKNALNQFFESSLQDITSTALSYLDRSLPRNVPIGVPPFFNVTLTYLPLSFANDEILMQIDMESAPFHGQGLDSKTCSMIPSLFPVGEISSENLPGFELLIADTLIDCTFEMLFNNELLKYTFDPSRKLFASPRLIQTQLVQRLDICFLMKM